MPRKTLKGIVVSDKMRKTVVVEVAGLKKHPRYHRYYKSSKRYKAHDEKGEYHIGDQVSIEETRPISKDKSWKVVGKIQKSKIKNQNDPFDPTQGHTEQSRMYEN